MTYKITRLFQRRAIRQTIKTGLTLEQAQAHCRDPETSSRTESNLSLLTKAYGPWFDAYEVEGK